MLLCTPSSTASSVTPDSPVRASTSRMPSARSTDCTPAPVTAGLTPAAAPWLRQLDHVRHGLTLAQPLLRIADCVPSSATVHEPGAACPPSPPPARTTTGRRVRPHPLLPRPSRHRPRRVRLPRRAGRQHRREPAVRRPPDRPVLHAHRLRRRDRRGRRGAARRVRGRGRAVRDGVRALGGRGADAHADHGVQAPALPQRPALPGQHRLAADRDPRRRVQPPRRRARW